MTTIWRELRLAARSLVRSPVFFLTALVSLSLAIGTSTAAFSVLDAVRFRALPFKNAQRLIVITENEGPRPAQDCASGCSVAYDTYDQVLRRHSFRTIDAVVAYTSGGKVMTVRGEQTPLSGGVTSPNLFPLLGVQPALGRGISEEDNRLGATPVTVLSHDLWSTHFGSDRRVLGTTVRLSDTQYTIVGVMPPGFDFESGTQFWLPAVPTLDPSTRPSIRSVTVLARLAPGRTLAQAQSELAAVQPVQPAGRTSEPLVLGALPLRDRYAASTQAHDIVFALIVAGILLIACANVTNLALVRGLGQQRDLAIRAALGAGRARLQGEVLLQYGLLVAASAAIGLYFAHILLRVLDALPVLQSLRPNGMEYRLDARALSISVLLSLAITLLLGLLPLRLLRWSQLQGALRSGTGASAAGPELRLQQLVVIAQVASAVALLAGGGLVTRTMLRLSRLDPGFAAGQLLQASPSLPHNWRVPERYIPVTQRITEQLRALPGVASVAVRSTVPLGERGARAELLVDNAAQPLSNALAPSQAIAVSSEYFSTIGAPLLRGRTFNAQDRAQSVPVAVVNEYAALRWWPGADAVGKHLTVRTAAGSETLTIVGMVRNNKAARPGLLLADDGPELYRPAGQAPSAFPAFLVRAAGSPGALQRPVRDVLLREVPDRPVFASLVNDQIGQQLRGLRSNALQVMAFALTGLFLAMIGIYGVIAHAANRRTREIAIRGALGATSSSILRLILREALVVTSIGLLLGVAAALATTRVLQDLLYGTNPRDPLVLAAAALLILLLALLASLIPARRAAAVEPVRILRA